MARKQSIEQLRVAQRKGRRGDRNVGITQACLEELRRHAAGRTARYIAAHTGFPLAAVKNALHHLQHVIGGVTSVARTNGTEHVFMVYTPSRRPAHDPDNTRFAAPMWVGRGYRWNMELL